MGKLQIGAIVLIGCIGLWGWIALVDSTWTENIPLYSCSFERTAGIYTVSKHELGRSGLLVFVHREGREFAFSRTQIKVCVEASVDISSR